ncbi:flippase [Lacticaseibacillus jixiensis]|uniref:flippase n=1 Tax=Lacticaseibacillus jixiensis TaxID=3231926 RepID=UPI0036F434BB
MRLLKNFFWNAGYQIFILIVPLVTIPYVNRILGPVQIGINAYTNSIAQYFILAGSLGISIYGNREIAYHKDNVAERSQVFWELAILRLATTFIASIAYFALIGIMNRYKIFFLAQSVIVVGMGFDISWYFQGVEKFGIIVIRSTLVRILSLVAIFVFVRKQSDLAIYILIVALSQTLGYLTLIPYLRGEIIRPNWKMLSFRRHIFPAIALLVPQVATQLYLQLNKTMLGVIDNVASSGYYDNADKIIKLILALVTATGTVLLPHVANRFAKGDKAGVQKALHVSIHIILLMAFPLAAGLVVVARPLTILFFSQKFLPVQSLIQIESLVIIFIGVSNAVGVQYLLPTNQVSQYTRSVVYGSAVNIILNIPMIIYWGARGAVVGTVISEAVVTIYQLLVVRDQLNIRVLFRETWKYCVASLIMFIGIFPLRFFHISLVKLLILEVVFGGIIYFFILIILRPHFLLKNMSQLLWKKR